MRIIFGLLKIADNMSIHRPIPGSDGADVVIDCAEAGRRGHVVLTRDVRVYAAYSPR